ncbi:MAG: motility protein A [Deltaproteobacteria bacterium]|jgi:chemotaxis protein MotA|nr:motility protein A [Deltaproteobacteria bacterium]
MDLSTLLGLVVSFVLVGEALSYGGDFSIFLNGPAALIVLGGSCGAIMTNYPLRVLFRTGGIIRKTLVHRIQPSKEVVAQFMDLAYMARREGILALDAHIADLETPYLRKGMRLAVDGLEPESIRAILEADIDNTHARHAIGVDLLNALASYAPALGMMGTVIGLVQMLRTLNDPSLIGPSMAVALITTFYGAVLSNLVFLPLCGKLKHNSQEEIRVMEMQLAGILYLAKGENPRVMREMLEGFQSPKERLRGPDYDNREV